MHPTQPQPSPHRELFLRLGARVLVRVHVQRDGAVSLLDVGLVGAPLQPEHGVALVVAAELVVRIYFLLHGGGVKQQATEAVEHRLSNALTRISEGLAPDCEARETRRVQLSPTP